MFLGGCAFDPSKHVKCKDWASPLLGDAPQHPSWPQLAQLIDGAQYQIDCDVGSGIKNPPKSDPLTD